MKEPASEIKRTANVTLSRVGVSVCWYRSISEMFFDAMDFVFFLYWMVKIQLDHWTKRVVRKRLII